LSRLAVLSDVHGNLPALERVLADAQGQGCDRVICLGDMVDGGEQNDEVVRALIAAEARVVLGNHDEFNELELAPDVQGFIGALPRRLVEGDVVYTHISPRDMPTKILSGADAWRVFREVSHRIVFVGHSHISFVFGERSLAYGQVTEHAFEFNTTCYLDPSDRYVISVGAVGYPRDGVRKIRYGIYDTAAESLEIRALDGPLL